MCIRDRFSSSVSDAVISLSASVIFTCTVVIFAESGFIASFTFSSAGVGMCDIDVYKRQHGSRKMYPQMLRYVQYQDMLSAERTFQNVLKKRTKTDQKAVLSIFTPAYTCLLYPSRCV